MLMKHYFRPLADSVKQCLAPRSSRSFASVTDLPTDELVTSAHIEAAHTTTQTTAQHQDLFSQQDLLRNPSPVLTTIHSWPDIQPQRFAWYHSALLGLPLRRDLLHRAVIYEADGHRRGTASTKWRDEVHGSGRKLHQQKGTGKARVGDRKSPIRRGGGVAFGPKPRDFSTELQRKVYDRAWRIALSHRYRKGELLIVDGELAVPEKSTRFWSDVFTTNQWGKGHGRSMLVADTLRPWFAQHITAIGEHAILKDIRDVDVKDCLETGRIVMEKRVLDALLMAHASDLDFIGQWSLPAARAQIASSMPEVKGSLGKKEHSHIRELKEYFGKAH